MNDQDATRLLHQLAERVPVGPAPVPDVVRNGRETRAHRRRTTVFAVAASVALIILGGLGVRQALRPSGMAPAAGPNATTAPDGPSATRAPTGSNASTAPAPAGTRLVGIGHAAIAVPKEWGTNLVTCGVPTANTVVINEGLLPRCAMRLPPDVSAVHLQISPDGPATADLSTAAEVSINGVPALKTTLRCTKGAGYQQQQGRFNVCTQALWIKAEDALFIASSPRADTVRRLLDSVRVDDRFVAVPFTSSADGTSKPRIFVRTAKALGLEVQTRTVHGSGRPAGWIVSVKPAVGTLLSPGDTVHVTVAAGAPGGQGTAPPLIRPATWCPISPQVQRLVVTRSLLPGNGITFSFPARVEVHDRVAIAHLVGALCAAPQAPKGVYHCPADNGLTYHVTAFNGATHVLAVGIHGSGCRLINHMGHVRRGTARVWHALASAIGVSPPTYQTLAGTPTGH